MDKQLIIKNIQQLRKESPQRKFSQSVDVIIALKNVDLKKTEDQVDVYTQLPHPRGKPRKIVAMVGPELKTQAESCCDLVIIPDDFHKYEGKPKVIKKVADECDFVIAMAALMPQIAKVFGRAFGPRGKMPNPKAGCVVPPNANLKPTVDRLRNTIRLAAKTQPFIQVRIGTEKMTDDQLVDNAFHVYNQIAHAVKDEMYNIREAYIKFTMGPVLKLGKENLSIEEREALKEASRAAAKAREAPVTGKKAKREARASDESKKPVHEEKNAKKEETDPEPEEESKKESKSKEDKSEDKKSTEDKKSKKESKRETKEDKKEAKEDKKEDKKEKSKDKKKK